MSRSPRTALVFALLLLLPGCGKDEAEAKPSGERTQEPVPETPKDAPTGPFAGFDWDATRGAWQGAWVLASGTPGQSVAWEVAATSLTQFDGETETTYEFAIYSPCQVTYTDPEAGVTTYQTFTFVGDTLHAGLGGAGTVIGDATVACISGKTYVLRGDVCLEWSEMFDDWKSSPAECTIEGEGEQRRFISPVGELAFVSATALANEQMQANAVNKHADFTAAKAALAGAGAP
jgi:hypothetical protein